MLTDSPGKKIEVTIVVTSVFTIDEMGEEFEQMINGLEEYVDDLEITNVKLIEN